MTFANPMMLHALWAALLPVVIHLLNRRRAVTVPFSNVALLQTLQVDRMRRVKLKQILLLLMRTLLIACLALAFARPTLRQAGGAERGGASTAAAVVLDRSMSTQTRTPSGTLFERGAEAATRILDLFDARDDVRLYLADDRSIPFEDARLDRIRLGVGRLEAGYRSTDLGPAVEEASAWLSESEMVNRELYVVTDGSASGWESLPDTVAMLDGQVVYVVTSRPDVFRNLSVSSLAPTGQLLAAGSPTTLRVTVDNTGETPVTDAVLSLFAGERRIAQQQIAVAPGKSEAAHVRFVPETGGAIVLRAEVGDDDLREDNVRVSVVRIPETLRVLLVGSPGDTYYLAQAFEAEPDRRIAVQRVSSDGLSDPVLAEADAIVLCDVPRLDRSSLNSLRRRVSEGAGLLILLGPRVDMRAYNSTLLPGLIPSGLISIVGTAGAVDGRTSLDVPDTSHPLFDGLIDPKTFKSPGFSVRYQVRPGTGVRTVASFRTGLPALLESSQGAGRVLLMASHTDLSWSDLSISGLFVPFVHRAARYLATGAFGAADYQAGDTVYRPTGPVGARDALVHSPSGESRTIWPEPRGRETVWAVGAAETPGLWEIYAIERLADRFAVQVDPDESNLTEVDDSRLENLFPGARVVFADPQEDLAEIVLANRHGRELWRAFLLAAILLMLAEGLVAATERRGRSSSPAPLRPVDSGR